MEQTRAFVRLERGSGCWLWIVERCPFCGREHQHGGGLLDGDPRRFLGGRVPHCSGGRWPIEYELVERPKEDT